MGLRGSISLRPLFFVGLGILLACSKAQPTASATEYGEPIGIDLGANLMVAVAAEKGHDVPGAAVPELAVTFAGVQKDCTVDKFTSLEVAVKDGVIAAPSDPKMSATAACVAKSVDGKHIKSLASSKLLIQVTPKTTK